MLSAIDTKGRPVVAWSLTPQDKKHGVYLCPTCRGCLIPKCGEEIIWHFAHEANTDCERAHVSESAAHIRAKFTVARKMIALGYEVEPEVSINGERRLDLRVTAPHGQWAAIEIQTSMIAPDEMRNRIRADRRAGAVDTLWVWANRLPVHDDKPRPQHLDLDALYCYRRTWMSLSIMRSDDPYLAILGRTQKEDAYASDTFMIEYMPATFDLVVGRGRNNRPTLRFGVVETDTIKDPNVTVWREVPAAEPTTTIDEDTEYVDIDGQ